jgi:small-conductance mechanosensitive channel
MFWLAHPKTYALIVLIVALYSLKTTALFIYRRRNHIKGKDNFTIGINTIYYVILIILMIVLAMAILRVNLREFFTSISILGAAIAIVAKDYFSNAINGMILMFNNQISIGDHIQIGAHKGKITHISLLNLQIVNEEDDLIYIPNTNVLILDIINYTKAESLKVSVEFVAKAHIMDSIESLESYFNNEFNSNPNVEKDSFRLKVIHIKYERIDLRAEANLIKRDSAMERQFKRQLVNSWFKYLQNADNKLSSL